jgi:hypothetical protein
MLHAGRFDRGRIEHGGAGGQMPQCAIAQVRGDHDLIERGIGGQSHVRQRHEDKQGWDRAGNGAC